MLFFLLTLKLTSALQELLVARPREASTRSCSPPLLCPRPPPRKGPPPGKVRLRPHKSRPRRHKSLASSVESHELTLTGSADRRGCVWRVLLAAEKQSERSSVIGVRDRRIRTGTSSYDRHDFSANGHHSVRVCAPCACTRGWRQAQTQAGDHRAGNIAPRGVSL